jgi:hypothetical protein
MTKFIMLNAGKIVGTIQTKAHMTNLSKVAERQSQWARLLCQHIRQILVTYTHQGGGLQDIRLERRKRKHGR